MNNHQPRLNINETDANEKLFNWKEIAKKIKTRKQKKDFIKNAKNQIAALLLEVTQEKKLTKTLLKKCSSQNCFRNKIVSEEDIRGEVNFVIGKLLKRWEKYAEKRLKNKSLHYSTSKKKVLRFDSSGDIIGYYRNALKNAFADLFVKYNAKKRFAFEIPFSRVYPDSIEADGHKNFEDDISGTGFNDMVYREHKKDMIQYLRSYDREHNTNLTKVFVVTMNPRYKGAVVKIQNRLKMNNKQFNLSNKILEKILRHEFGDISRDIVGYFETKRGFFDDLEKENRESRTFKNRKIQKKMDKKNRPHRLNIIYGQRTSQIDHKKWIYYVTLVVDRSKTTSASSSIPENWENVYKTEKIIEGKSNEMTKMKPKLEKLIKKDLQDAEKIVNSDKTGDESKGHFAA